MSNICSNTMPKSSLVRRKVTAVASQVGGGDQGQGQDQAMAPAPSLLLALHRSSDCVFLDRFPLCRPG